MKNYQIFTAVVDGQEINFRCWSADKSITHYCEDEAGRRSRISWGNRTWECFRYESVLRKAIEKYPRAMQPELRAQIIDRTEKEEAERCGADLARFQSLHASLNEDNKNSLAELPQIETEAQASAVFGLMALMVAMQ